MGVTPAGTGACTWLELRQRPVSQEHARPQPPAASRRRYGGEGEGPAPVPVGVTGHQTQRPRGQVGPPRSIPIPSQLTPGPRGRTVANISYSWPG
jgi:hypothetical protein